jgi:O-antigen/teichoic acid export membrane protein
LPSGGRALAGGIWTGASQFVPYLYTTITSIVAARILGPTDMGRQSFIAFVVLIAQTICTSGLSYSIARYVGELMGRGESTSVRSLVSLGWKLAFGASLVAAGALVAVAAAGAEPREAWLFGAVAVLAGGLHKVPASTLIGGQHWRSQSVIVLVTGAASVVATIVVLELDWGVNGMIGVLAVATVAMLAWSMRLARRFVRSLPVPQVPLDEITRRAVVTFAAANSVPVILTFLVMQRSEFFFLDYYSSDAQIAYYSIAFATMLALLALPSAIRMVVIPSVANLVGAGDFDRIRRGFSRLVRLSILVTFPLTAAALSLGPDLITLIYGAPYAPAGTVLLILAAPIPLVPLSSSASALLTGYGRIKVPTLVSGGAALVDVGAAALLVPHLDAKGAAIANVLALVTASLLLLPHCSRIVGGIDVSRSHVVRIAVTSALAGGAARLVLTVGEGMGIFIAAAAVGVALFGVLAVVLKVVPRQDADWLVGLAQARGSDRIERFARLVAS